MPDLSSLRSAVGQIVFGKIWLPPSVDSLRSKTFEGDYGNGFLYEELFAGNGTELLAAKKICRYCEGEVLDAGGGTGRLAANLAAQGVGVTLLDCSQYMLSQAEKKREELPLLVRQRFSIVEGDLTQFRVSKKFDVIFAVNSVFEHFADRSQTLKALKNMASHLRRDGKFYLDVHHQPSMESNPKWLTGKWRYNFDKKIAGKRYRVWQRTLPDIKSPRVVSEQAFTTNLRQYLFSRTLINIFPVEEWFQLFRDAGFTIYNVWGNWAMEPVSPSLPKMVIKLGLK